MHTHVQAVEVIRRIAFEKATPYVSNPNKVTRIAEVIMN